MFIKKIFSLLLLLYGFCTIANSQTQNPDSILNTLKKKYLQIQDYQADIEIKVDVEFINIPVKKAKIYYKQPDKYKFDAEGFFMLPKRGLNFSVNEMLNYQYTAITVKEELVDSALTRVLKIIPLENEVDVVLMTLWIDTQDMLIRKVETNTKNAGTFLMELSYNDQNHGLPSQVKVSFEVMPIELPMTFTGEMQSEVQSLEKDKKTTGTVTISYANYQINKGLSDAVFKKRFRRKDSLSSE